MIAVGGSHSVPVLTGEDGGLVDQSDLCHTECMEGVKSFDDSGMDGLACDPSLVLLSAPS